MKSDDANQLVLDDTTDAAKADMIDRTTWCHEFSWKQIELMAEFFEVMQVREGTVIFSEGSRDAYMCLVVERVVWITKEDSEQDAKGLAKIGPGKTFGEMSLVDGQPRSATATARQPATLLVLTQRSFENLCERYPRVAIKLLLKICNLVSQRLRQTSGRIVDFL